MRECSGWLAALSVCVYVGASSPAIVRAQTNEGATGAAEGGHADMPADTGADEERNEAVSGAPSEESQTVDEASLGEEARSLFATGRAAFDEGRYDAALESFQQAYDLTGRPELLYDIGVAADKLRRDELAVDAYKRYLAGVPGAPNIFSVRQRISLITSQREQRRLEADRAERAANATGAYTKVTDSSVDTGRQDTAGLSRAGKWLVGSGAAGLAGMVGAAVWWKGRNDALNQCDADPGQMCTPESKDEIRSQRTGAIVTTALLGVLGGSLIVVGLSVRETKSTATRCGLGLASAQCRVRF